MSFNAIGYWQPGLRPAHFDVSSYLTLIENVRTPLYVVFDPKRNQLGIAAEGNIIYESSHNNSSNFPVIAALPGIFPEWLGDASFRETHGVRFNYAGGSMARGIASAKLVIELAQAGMLGFFGAAGLAPARVEKEILTIKAALDPKGLPWGANLIHSPGQPGLEEAITDLYLKLGVNRVEASAFMHLAPSIVRYSCRGLYRDAQGNICRRHHVFAKISREEVARHFLSPPPAALLETLCQQGKITAEEAALARQIPLCDDITVESDSGGHTDNRPLNALFPTIVRLRDELSAKHQYTRPIRIGAAGSLGTPEGVAAAFALGAAYVLLGSVHQACLESGLSDDGKLMLAQAGVADVIMTASADMFEMGVKVQVLKKGILMGVRGNQLYELYGRYASLEEIPVATRENLEKNIFRQSLDAIWEETVRYFQNVDPNEIARAEKEPRHRMALVFRWYLGNSSRWPILETLDRRTDYQIWCGPAMGAFNKWVKGTFLEKPENRQIQQVAINLLEGAAQVSRAQQLRSLGVQVPENAFSYVPKLIEL